MAGEAKFTTDNTNMTTSTGLSAGMQTYYNRKLLETFEPNLVHLQFGEEYPLPANSGKIMNIRKMIPIQEKTTELTEGNPPDATLVSETSVNMEIHQYGDFAYYTDLLDMTHMDVRIEREATRFGEAGSRAVDALVRDKLAKCTNVIYAGAATSRETVKATDKLTSLELRKAVKMLKKANAQTFNGWYIAIVGPDAIFDLQDDERFLAVAKYQDKEKVYTGEIGRLYGVRLIETTQAAVFEGKGAATSNESNAPKYDVASTIVLGRYAYGYTGLKGIGKPRIIVTPLGSAGAADPLQQIQTVGWKIDAFGVEMLQSEYAVRIEHGYTA